MVKYVYYNHRHRAPFLNRWLIRKDSRTAIKSSINSLAAATKASSKFDQSLSRGFSNEVKV